MSSVHKSEHEKNLEHSKKRSRPSLLRPVSAPAKVTAHRAWTCARSAAWPSCGWPGEQLPRPSATGLGQEAESRPESSLKFTVCGGGGRRLNSKVAVHLFPLAYEVVRGVVSSST